MLAWHDLTSNHTMATNRRAVRITLAGDIHGAWDQSIGEANFDPQRAKS